MSDRSRQDRAWNDYVEHFRKNVLPNLMDSGMFLSIGGPPGEFDVKQAAEFGAAMILGKPIAIVVPKGRTVPPCIRRAADYIFDDWDVNDPASQEAISIFVKKITDETRGKRPDA